MASHYEYDANGNRTVGPGLVASPVCDSQDRLLSSGACTYTYKADGSLQTKTCPGGTTTYDYDAFGNLRDVTLPNGTAITYLTDGKNRRVGKKVNGVLVESFLYEDDLKRVGWYDAAGAIKAQFVYGKHHVPESMVKAGQTYRFVYDQVGSVRELVATDGSVLERLDYDEFGVVVSDTNPGFQPFGFAGGLQDAEVTLVRFGRRDYDPAVGRWTAKDPLVFGGHSWNLYSYVHQDPINRNDPTGEDDFCVWPGDGSPPVCGPLDADGCGTVCTAPGDCTMACFPPDPPNACPPAASGDRERLCLVRMGIVFGICMKRIGAVKMCTGIALAELYECMRGKRLPPN